MPAVPALHGSVATALGPPSAIEGFVATSRLVADFRRACRALATREDLSGFTRPQDWAPACADQETDPARFFDRHFLAVRLADGEGLLTGYYQPWVPAREMPEPGLAPVLGLPASGACDGGICPTRAEIEAGALEGRAPVLGWADPIDLFFLQVQGSGVLLFPDGRERPVGFAGHNGHGYVGIGRLLRERGLVAGPVGMAEIRAWLAENGAAGRALMQENPRYIFFAPRNALSPFGALGVPLGPMEAIAIDPRHVPLGAPAWLEGRVAGAPWAGAVLAADTGAAIVGPNRIDLFIGTGDRAGEVAGSLQERARLTIFLPRAAAGRLAR
jgi:membrane-bound lytic murein transglycosylase A